MTDRLTALVALKEAVEADRRPYPHVGTGGHGVKSTINGIDLSIWKHVIPAFDGSVDAALSLLAAVLPGWKVAGIRQTDDGKWWVELRRGYITSYDRVVIEPKDYRADDPARALLLTIIAAKIEEERNAANP